MGCTLSVSSLGIKRYWLAVGGVGLSLKGVGLVGLFLLGSLSFANSKIGFAANNQVVVKWGDSLSVIAKRHSVTVDQLRKWNRIKGDLIYPGQRLLLGEPKPIRSFSLMLSTKPVLDVSVAVVHVNLAHPKVSLEPLLPRSGIGHGGAALTQLAKHQNLIAVINGGYFHPQTYWPAGDLVVNGKLLAGGRILSAIAITPDKEASILTQSRVRPVAWKGYETVIASGPHIVQKGRVVVEPRAEGYRDPSIWRRAKRSAVGLIDDQYLILLSTSRELTLNELGKIMVRLGVQEAIALDGGSSAGLVWRDRVLVRPARSISYGIGVFIEDTD